MKKVFNYAKGACNFLCTLRYTYIHLIGNLLSKRYDIIIIIIILNVNIIDFVLKYMSAEK